MAIKPASRGEGVIVRLYALVSPESDVLVTAHHFPVVKAFLCDTRERDLESLEVRDGTVQLAMPGTIATIRLLGG
jgi:alpha-mannosidase